MENYIDKILGESFYKKEILQKFFINSINELDILMYKKDSLEKVAKYMLELLEETSIKEIIDIIEVEVSNIEEITSKNIPQFSNLDALEDVIRIVESNPGCNYELIGYYFNKNGSKASQLKYGENHYKTAALLNLVSMKKPYQVTFLGKEYIKLNQKSRRDIKVKLYLMIPIVQRSIIEAKYHEVKMMTLLSEYLSKSTAIRRKSNVKAMIDYICRYEEGLEVIESNLKWR